MIPTIGRIVHYRLGEHGAAQINKRREDAYKHIGEHREKSDGSVVHAGNAVRAGDVYPLIITRTWGESEGSLVNGQLLLDGNDSFWVTSAAEGDGEGNWFVPPRV